MRIMTVAVGTALVMCNLGTFGAAAQARTTRVVRAPQQRLFVSPVVRPTPYWDSYIVPRYRYRPEDDRVDPYGPPPSRWCALDLKRKRFRRGSGRGDAIAHRDAGAVEISKSLR
jgi:hypothetical protein